MNLFLVYLLLLKATLSAFSGLAALPVLREEFVVQHHLLTDRQLNTALVVGRTTPGPKGLYIVSVGYYAAGFPGAVMAWLALLTPAFLVIPLLVFAGRFAQNPGVRRSLRTVVLASAGVSLSATLPLAADALHGPVTWGIAGVSLVVLLRTGVETVWVILGAAMVALAFGMALGLN
jgi:chromate transporter